LESLELRHPTSGDDADHDVATPDPAAWRLLVRQLVQPTQWTLELATRRVEVEGAESSGERELAQARQHSRNSSSQPQE
jgi:hypothetical protein